MTRDEAIKKVEAVDVKFGWWSEILVDRLAALGLLKLEELKSVEEEEAVEAIEWTLLDSGSCRGTGISQTGAKIILSRLKQRGFKITRTG